MAGLELSLAKGAVNVEGSVTDADGKGAGQTSIASVPLPDKRDQWRLFRRQWPTRMAGFVFRNLSPGEYTRLAFGSNGDPSVVKSPEYLKQIESKGTLVKPGENARESVQLKVAE